MNILSRLYDCINRKKVNNSQAREAIYKVFLKSESCMSVADISIKLQETYVRKISLNTIYRQLTLFVECGLVIVIQDDHKKAYYTLTGEKAKIFSLCTKCKRLSMLKDVSDMESILIKLDNNEFITMYGKCKRCK